MSEWVDRMGGWLGGWMGCERGCVTTVRREPIDSRDTRPQLRIAMRDCLAIP